MQPKIPRPMSSQAFGVTYPCAFPHGPSSWLWPYLLGYSPPLKVRTFLWLYPIFPDTIASSSQVLCRSSENLLLTAPHHLHQGSGVSHRTSIPPWPMSASFPSPCPYVSPTWRCFIRGEANQDCAPDKALFNAPFPLFDKFCCDIFTDFKGSL